MRKLTILLALVLALIYCVNLSAEPAQTVEDFYSALFKQGDLKLAFSMLASEDQNYIKTIAPDAYNFIMGDMGEEMGEFAAIANSVKSMVLTTMGKLIKVEVQDVKPSPEGDEVFYSMYIPTDLDFVLKLKSWIEAKEDEFNDLDETEDPIAEISKVIKEFSKLLDDVSFKTSVSVNTFAVVINENGQDKIFFDLMGTQAKLMQLE